MHNCPKRRGLLRGTIAISLLWEPEMALEPLRFNQRIRLASFPVGTTPSTLVSHHPMLYQGSSSPATTTNPNTENTTYAKAVHVICHAHELSSGKASVREAQRLNNGQCCVSQLYRGASVPCPTCGDTTGLKPCAQMQHFIEGYYS